ncbi:MULTISPECIES: hypothetical protein [Pseudomonas]|uniref:Uncharacterized protein n=1 Tax=Pseudomonas kuykendallii TaxID=1007099 RepID=A0A1H2Z8F9_9PSED|nr:MULTISPECIES: hypothetical protein [Pseudomonas]MCQ4273495.1 hypothetical protein [Pseudomonas kuykendallii]SDX13268.1 hypothetical protein SAMN05216287_2191 [Pseudomonas kuykendallii]
MSTPHPSVLALRQLQEIAAQWKERQGNRPLLARDALTRLYELWQPTAHGNDFERQAEYTLLAVQRLFNDWNQRGENDEELLTQMLWLLEQRDLVTAQKEYLADLGPSS